MTSFIKKLPSVFQTTTERKFFAATADQVFSKKDSELLYGYLGQRNPGQYDPVNDFYLPEPTKDRTWWQLEATAFSRNADYTKSNIFFYDDLLNRINHYGGNTLNQDRLFSSEYYSWAPPIDFDMFTNYQNYYWVEQGLVSINITGVMYSDIAGASTFNTDDIPGATPANLTLTTGMVIVLVDDTANSAPLTVEFMGGDIGIRLVPQFPDYTAGSILEFLPWDGTIELANHRIIRNANLDVGGWDVQTQPGNADYITIERGSLDRNAWSRTNKWVHIEAINATINVTGTPFPSTATRALRPIIQFVADLILYNSGEQFLDNINYGIRNNFFGNPILLSQVQGQSVATVESLLGVNITDQETFVFMNDVATNNTIYKATIAGTVTFASYDTAISNDIVFVTSDAEYDGATRGQTWYYENNVWAEAANDKIRTNQPPLFQLYDHTGVQLDDAIKYPASTFVGSKIFSYKVNTSSGARVDPVLNFSIVYTSLGQASDIVFQNNLITDRYVYTTAKSPINGYYYYNTVNGPTLFNNWDLYDQQIDDATSNISKQRVIDKFVVGYGSRYQFKLSVTPYGYPGDADVIVNVNGVEVKPLADQINGYSFTVVNGDIYVDLEIYLTALMLTVQTQAPVVELSTHTHGLLSADAPGYFEIPQQLRANPNQLEISEISASNLIEQFTSIIQNQTDFTGVAFGGPNNYRDSLKNRSVGSSILQNATPLLKSMLVSSSADLDVIAGIRFSQDEYAKFKNKFLRTALQLINQEFNPVQYHDNTIVVSAWVDEILKTVNISKEFSNAFAYSYMIANGSPYASELQTIPIGGLMTLANYVDLSDSRNALYAYDVTGQEYLLVVGTDYNVSTVGTVISIQFSAPLIGNDIYVALYKNPLPAYIPTTPTKNGAYSTFIPRIEMDTSYTVPTNVIIGHDGSKTIAYNDYRDQLLLELERRIYNLLQPKFRDQYSAPLRIESVNGGYFRNTRYSRAEYLDITSSTINKWSAKNKANYRANDWSTLSADLPTDSPELWKLYNYSRAVSTHTSAPFTLPGNWKGIFQYFYDTIYPDTRPWEMLGFSAEPSWWVGEYGSDWSSVNTSLWVDLELGIIRQGPSAIYDTITGTPISQPMWARPGLSGFIPVDALGAIIPVPTLFDITMSGNLYAPFDGFDDPWVYGDGSPVEQVWLSTSGYAFSVQEFLYLMRPAAFGELLWDTVGTERSPGTLLASGVQTDLPTVVNYQYVQNDVYQSADPFFAWMRAKNKDQYVHAEIVDSVTQIRHGYQRWISDRLLFLGKNIGDTFGQKVRTLDVNLANKLAGFTNKDTTTTYLESASVSATTTSLLIPSNNFEVILHKGQPIRTYSYSGVVVRALGDGTFVVYGYDLLNSEFKVLDRSNAQTIKITIGGSNAPFKVFTLGETYYAGDIIRYNGVYYTSLVTHIASRFVIGNWQKLNTLPVSGGVSVNYRPVSETTITAIPYGTVIPSAQGVFDLLIGWGAYLESQGWEFTDVSVDTNQVSDWLYSAKQFLFWLNTDWAPDASIQVSPAANRAILTVSSGYPDDVETTANGVYCILDKFGVAIPPNGTTIDRDGRSITVSPVDLATGGIYFIQVSASETEHILMFDNTTSFNDVIYDPLLQARQQRLRFNGFRSNGWYGKMEAGGYLIMGNQLVPNFDTMVDSMRYFYDPDVTIDNPSLEDLGRHLIGYESKSYLDNLQVSNDVQYLFYQGAIRQKGTTQSFDKLFRSSAIQTDESIEVFEEWALKLGDFGNTIEQVSTEFILRPEQNTGEVVVARLNFIPSSIGHVKEINIVNAQNTYDNVPRIAIAYPDADPADPALTEPLRQAKAYAVLATDGKISRIDMTDLGYGYLTAPYLEIESGIEPNQLDKLYAVWQGDITHDTTLDNIIEIDIDDTALWTVRPPDPQYALEFPTTDNINYQLPNAGYVNFNDVVWSSFDVIQTATGWGTSTLNPVESDTVWVAKTFTEDWDVYKMVNMNPVDELVNVWKVVSDTSGNLLLLLNIGTTITPQLTASPVNRTDFGNMVCLQIADNGNVDAATNYAVGFSDNGIYIDPITLDNYNSYSLLTLDGVPITSDDIPLYESFTDLLLFKTMRWLTNPDVPLLPIYVGLGDYIWVDNINGGWAVMQISADPGDWDIVAWDPTIITYWATPSSYGYGWDVSAPLYFTPHRIQMPLINTQLFESIEVFQTRTQTELVLLPVYDPFKAILPALAKQNITYMLEQDPARYNVTGDLRLFSETPTLNNLQVGKLWWDLSDIRYVYYEQPMSLSNGETPTQNLVYRRDRWGQMFPGSVVRIYEWTRSQVPPAQYTGTGTPRSTTDYVQLSTSNRFTNITETYYYFWVLNPTDKPNVINRTLAAQDVSRLLASPKRQGFAFFAPIQQTAINNSYMFYNVQDILAYKGDNIQVKYRLADRNDQTHTQWKFFREGDIGSVVTAQYWDKMVDSLCAYTKVLPPSDEWANSIVVADHLPWDIFGWDVAPYDNATLSTVPTYGEILPVPDPSLSESEKYGIEYRPRQSMFVDLLAARKIFVQSANELLSHIAIRDDNPSWSTGVSTDVYWAYTNWYEIGYADSTPNVVYQTLDLAQAALTAGSLTNGTIVEVTNGTTDGRFAWYMVVQVSPLIDIQSFQKICVEQSAIKLLDTIYTDINTYGLSVELRELLQALRTEVFIEGNLVDQNELYFSLLNYVLSEQRNPDWVFKSSYIYIKESNLPLSQDMLYMPDQINNIIDYIKDSKPYHTQIRDYTSTHTTTDLAFGTVYDTIKHSTIITFGPLDEHTDGDHDEYVTGDPIDNFVVNVDTQLPVNLVDGIIEPYVGWGETWDSLDPTGVVAGLILAAGGQIEVSWDAELYADPVTLLPEMLPNIISYKEYLQIGASPNFYRNADEFSGTLVNALVAPIIGDAGVVTILVASDILPAADSIWVGGERITYTSKTLVDVNTWELVGVVRGTIGTAPTLHAIGSKVFVENGNEFASATSNIDAWNIQLPASPDIPSEVPGHPGEYTRISGVLSGGIWYATTTEAEFLKDQQGSAIT